jgi:hypothetical protein
MHKLKKELKMKITRSLLESLSFRPFTKNDYYGFAGVQSPVPMIADGIFNGQEFMVILDGDYAELYTYESTDGAADTCDNIRELPYKSAVQKALEDEIAEVERSLADMKTLLSELK